MSLAEDLFEQADHLASWDPRRPKQASLRRAISTAYYSLFHLLCGEATAALVSGEEFRTLLARAFSHTDMKKACRPFAAGHLPDHLLGIAGTIVPPDLQRVAKTFIDLQEARHEADYNLGRAYNRPDIMSLLQTTREAFDAWRRVRSEAAAKVFLVSLLIGDRWNR
jgi:hypothetical protein